MQGLSQHNKKNIVLGFIVGGIIGLGDGFGGLITSALAGSIICMFADIITYKIIRNMWSDKIKYSIQHCMLYGSTIGIVSTWPIGIILLAFGLGSFNNIALISVIAGLIVGPSAGFQIRKELDLRQSKSRLTSSAKDMCDAIYNAVIFKIDVPATMKLGIENNIRIVVNNPTNTPLHDLKFKTNLPKHIKSNNPISKLDVVFPQSSVNLAIPIIPMSVDNIPLGDMEITFLIYNQLYKKKPIALGTHAVIEPELDVEIHVQDQLKLDLENPVKIIVNNRTNTQISNINFKTNFPSHIICDKTTAQITNIPPHSSKYTTILIIPKIADKIDFGNLDMSVEINGNTYEKKPIAIGIHEAVSDLSLIHI